MSWIKRNLFFVIGSFVALALMGLAGWFLYTKWNLNNQILADLKTNFDELKGLTTKSPHPGDGKINNIQNAKDQQLQLSNYVAKARIHFEPIQRLPSPEDAPKITDRDLTTALSKTVDQLQRQAASASVNVISNYYFSFEALRGKVSFDAKGLLPLATQLGEVKAICDVLFAAKVNSLDNIRRERVAAEDSLGGLQTDYLTEKKTTNDLAVLTPYEITFKCFSSELAAVLAGLASSPHAMMIKTINVEGAPITQGQEQPGYGMPVGVQYTQPQYVPQPTSSGMGGEADAQARMAARYGLGGAGRGMGRYGGAGPANMGGIAYRGIQPQQPQTYVPPAVPYGAVAPATTSPKTGGLPTVLDERQLKVTVNLLLIKLLPPKS
jgi:hypothetical protein